MTLSKQNIFGYYDHAFFGGVTFKFEITVTALL